MTEYQVAAVEGGHRVYATDRGVDRRYVGPIHATPREAIAYSDTLADPTPRSASRPDLARLGAESRDGAEVPFEAPDLMPVASVRVPAAEVPPAAAGDRTPRPTTPGVPDGYALSGSPEVAGTHPDHSASPPGDLVLGLT